ncbi:MAG: DUF2752 domain-containing protein [Pyrinomonadaceae bacterium]|nr:DUF2752 domain-containing protein [Pyrinomonadaceae bacterium]
MTLDGIVNRRLTVLFMWLTLAAGATYLFIFEPGRSGFFPICLFREMTGFACPGCGSTRGMHALLHGDVLTAFKFNPFMMLALPFLIYVLVRHTNAVMRDQPINRNRLDAKYIWMMFVAILGFWILRNTPFYPFPV